MTAKEEILSLLQSNEGGWFTHSYLAKRTGYGHQVVFQICTNLSHAGIVQRERIGREWWLCYGQPSGAPRDEGARGAISFGWISDRSLRDVVQADWDEASRCLIEKCWKAAILLCGSCLEGVLVAALELRRAEAQPLLSQEAQRYGIRGAPLRELARAAVRLKLINRRAADFLIDSRNLIHAGVAAKEGKLPSEADAKAAFELLCGCIRATAQAASGTR